MLTLMNRKQLPKWLAAGLFVFTTAAVAVYPTLQRPVIDSVPLKLYTGTLTIFYNL